MNAYIAARDLPAYAGIVAACLIASALIFVSWCRSIPQPKQEGTRPVTRYTLVNPSDAYEFEAPDDAVAEVVATALSTMAGWETIDEEPQRSGGFAGLNHRTEESAQRYSEEVVRPVVEGRRSELRAALLTVEIDPERRKRLGVDPEVWHDEMRTSVSDFRAAALSMAASLDDSLVESSRG